MLPLALPVHAAPPRSDQWQQAENSAVCHHDGLFAAPHLLAPTKVIVPLAALKPLLPSQQPKRVPAVRMRRNGEGLQEQAFHCLANQRNDTCDVIA